LSSDVLGRTIRPGRLTLPTDVLETGTITGAGATVTLDGDPDRVTSGIVLRWSVAGNPTPLWGILTVAHGFQGAIAVAAPTDVYIDLGRQGSFRGKRLINLKPPYLGVDACLIQVGTQDLLQHALIGTVSDAAMPITPFNDVNHSRFAIGSSLQADRTITYTVFTTLADLTIGNVGTVRHLIHVRGAPNAFVRGTSGSLFRAIDATNGRLVPLAIQVGSDEATFSNGYGQSLATILDIVRPRLSQLYEPSWISGPLEVISAF
jgi:hypothetical protein